MEKVSNLVKDFNEYRSKMNQKILEADNLVIKRFFNLDTNAYSDGVLSIKTKEMLGLVASMVLRCDDCIKYHIQKCYECQTSKQEFFEVFQIALIVGGSIVIPHLRRAVEFLEELESTQAQPNA
jgi:AhpD family alkylhydroperoxidase